MKVSISAEGIILGERNLDVEHMRIGRQDDCELLIDDPTVSRLHAEIKRVREGLFTITALSKTNETVINGMEMTFSETVELDPGDLIVLSGTVHIRVGLGSVAEKEPEITFDDPIEIDEDAPTSVMTPSVPTPPTSSGGTDADMSDTTVLGPGQQVLHELDVVRAELADLLRTDRGVKDATRKAEAALQEAREKLAKAQSVTEELRAKHRAVQRELKVTQGQILARGRENQKLRADLRKAESDPPGRTRRVPRTAKKKKPVTRSAKRPPREPPPTTEKMKRRREPPPTTQKMPRTRPPVPPGMRGPRKKPRPPKSPD